MPPYQIIRDEHSTLAAVLRSIGLLLNECRRRSNDPDFQVLRAMLFYIDEFSGKSAPHQGKCLAVSAAEAPQLGAGNGPRPARP
jgi:hypothetical protein